MNFLDHEANEPDELLLETPDDDIENDILNEMNASPGDNTYTFRVGRVTGLSSKGSSEPELFRGDGTDVTTIFDRLKEQYGDGKYRVRIHKNGRLWKRFDMTIELPKNAKPQASPIQQSEMAVVLAAIEKQNERTLALMERIAERASVPAVTTAMPDPMAMFDKILGVVQKMQPQRIEQPDVAAKSVELILQGIELGKSVSSEGRETGMMDIVRDLLQSPLIAKLAESQTPAVPQIQLPPRHAQRRQAPNNQQGNDKQSPLPPPSNTEQPPPPAGNPQAQEFRNLVLYLLVRADHGSSYETYAEWAFDSIPPPMIRELLAQPNPMAILKSVAPEIARQEEWFNQLLAELRELVKDADEADISSDHAPRATPSPVGPLGNPGRESGGGDDIEDDV